VLRVETGGGSAMAADVIWREVQITAKIKPVIVSMGSYAASGGYYIAAPATRIFANPLSITGSIGIFYGKADIAQLFGKLGLTVETYKTAPRADAESIFRPFSDDERRELNRKVAQFYDMFVSRVAIGRNLTKPAVDAAGQGRVWTGEQARAHKLVDELGGLRQALAYARQLADLVEDAPITELPVPEQSLIGMLLGLEGVRADVASTLPPELLSIARALSTFTIHPADKPLAKMELVAIEP
jgi:protease-4